MGKVLSASWVDTMCKSIKHGVCWRAADAHARLQHTQSIALIDPEGYDAIFFAGLPAVAPRSYTCV